MRSLRLLRLFAALSLASVLSPPDVAACLGNYPALGKRAATAIPAAMLVEFDDLGHSPQVEAPERFNAALLEAIGTR